MTHFTKVRFASASAMVVMAAALAAPAQAQEADGEIIVTATKRDATLSDTPIAASALSGEQLADANAQSLADYITRLPGVVFNDYQPGVSEVVIRGIAATTYHEQGQTTVGYYLNEIPLVEPGFPIGIPDVDTFDLDRVEVLRGPQGTLFGSSSLGGAVNYVVNTADPAALDAAASALLGYTDNAHKANYAGKVMINVPIIKDVLAIRGMALQRFDAGWIDNIPTGNEGSNNFRTRALRGSIVATPGPDTKITWMTAYQDTKLDDQPYITSPTDLTRSGIAREEPQETSFLLNSLRLDQDLGFADFTAFGSVDAKKNTTVFSYPFYGYLTGIFTGEDAPYSVGNAVANIKQVEARLASKSGDVFSWLIGASYIKATKYSDDRVIAPGAELIFGPALADNDYVYGYISDTKNEDFGVFGEVSVRPVTGLELTVGGRYYSNKYTGTVINTPGAVSGSTTGSTATVANSENGFTPKVTLALRPNDDVMAYMTYSKGYRIGGINPNAGFLPSIPLTYDSDTVDNYEAGIKAYMFDKRLYIDAAVFTLDWKGIQARLFGPAPNYYSYVVNAGGANVTGVELAATLALTRTFSASTNVTYQDAALTAFLPDTFAVGGGYAVGSTLPGSSEWSVASSLRYEGETALKPTFEVAHRYLSSAPVAFGNPNTRGNYHLVDLRASVTVADMFKIMAFANNVFNERGVLNAPFTSQLSPAYSVTKPRTVGVRLDWNL